MTERRGEPRPAPEVGRRAERNKAERERQRRTLALAGAAVALVVVIALVAALRGGESAGEGRVAPTTTTGFLVSAGLEEAGDAQDIDLSQAKFVSIIIQGPEGLKSTMISPERPAFATLVAAVTTAAQVEAVQPEDSGSLLTFVLPDRRTVAYVLDLEQNLMGRQGKAWRPAEPLSELLAQAEESG